MNYHDIKFSRLSLIFPLLLYITGCTNVQLVQPYDADLYNNTENFYKKASAVIARGISVSPKMSDEVRAITDEEKEEHPAHYKQFKADYDAMLIDTNALILRSLANSNQVDKMGKKIQSKIENVITTNLPSECDSLQEQFADASLTTRNYIDLKCIIGRWDDIHQGGGTLGDVTYGKHILKRSNWEGRAKTLFDGILAIQKAEASKNDKQ